MEETLWSICLETKLLYFVGDYVLCYMELREGDVAENQNIRSSRLSIGRGRPAGEFEKQNC